MSSRNVALPLGDVRWLFPALADAADYDHVRQAVEAADESLYGLGQRLGAWPDAQVGGLPLNRFMYQRLGPGPDFPVTVLIGEGGSEEVWVDVLFTPAGRSPYCRPGPPRQVNATIRLRCDTDPDGCGGHSIATRTGQPIGDPLAAAKDLRGAIQWLLDRLANETDDSLRKQDRRRGHPPDSRRRD